MFYGAHDDDLCDLLLSHLFDGEKPMPPEVAGSAARIRSFDGRGLRTWTAHIPAWLVNELAARDIAIHIHLSGARC